MTSETTTTETTIETPAPTLEPDGPSTRIGLPEREVVETTETTVEPSQPIVEPPDVATQPIVEDPRTYPDANPDPLPPGPPIALPVEDAGVVEDPQTGDVVAVEDAGDIVAR